MVDPLCFGGGAAGGARRAVGGGGHDREVSKPPCPLRAQRFDGMKHTPRVVIPPPHRSVEKMQNGSLITAPNRAPAETQRSGFGGKKAVQRSERVFVGGSDGNE